MAYIGNNAAVYYVYLHHFSNGTCYVGKGKDRRIDSLQRSKYWKRLYSKYGTPIKLKIVENITESEAFNKEVEAIARFTKLGVKLCNHTSGGEGASGVSMSDETKEKISAANKKRFTNLEERLAQSIRSKKMMTDEVKKKIGKANKGKVPSEATREKMSIAQKNRFTLSKERVTMSEKIKDIVNTKERRLLMEEKVYSKNRNQTLCKFEHKEYGTEICTGYELYTKYKNLDKIRVNDMRNGKRKSHKGWKIIMKEAL